MNACRLPIIRTAIAAVLLATVAVPQAAQAGHEQARHDGYVTVHDRHVTRSVHRHRHFIPGRSHIKRFYGYDRHYRDDHRHRGAGHGHRHRGSRWGYFGHYKRDRFAGHRNRLSIDLHLH